jgi:hypothetical protein
MITAVKSGMKTRLFLLNILEVLDLVVVMKVDRRTFARQTRQTSGRRGARN